MHRNFGSLQLESLESRVLFSVIKPSDFGAIVNDGKDDRAAIQKALDTAKKGDTIQFGAGEYDIAGQLKIKSDRILLGATGNASKLVFSTGKNDFAILLDGKSQNVTIDGLSIRANAGGILAKSRTENLRIVNNDMVWGYDGNYYNRLGIRSLSSNSNLSIEHNYFHDSMNDRAVDLANVSDSSYSHNKFYKVADGGHIDGWTQNFKFIDNTAKYFHRMGLELQDHDGGGQDILIAGNVFTDWYQPYNESFGLSIMPQRATNVVVRDNYLDVGDAELSGGSHRGYGIEAGFKDGVVRGNTMVGSWIAAVSVSMPDTPLRKNKSIGDNAWGAFTTEPGLNGTGSIDDRGLNRSF